MNDDGDIRSFRPKAGECGEVSIQTAYDAGSFCFDVDDPNNQVEIPLLLETRDGRILYSYQLGRVAKTVAWDAEGELSLDITHAPIAFPTSIAMGSWTAGMRVSAVATMDGELSLYSDATGAKVWSAKPTQSTGSFAFTMRVPMGGFFGTHIILTRIQWEDADHRPQEVVLPEWFQVVDENGIPVISPFYSVVALMQVADMPMVP